MTENELSNIIIGHAIDVHQSLGPGLLESAIKNDCITGLLKMDILQKRKNLCH